MTNTVTATNARPLLFESKVCSRCGGTGNFSYCQRYGTTCFGCGGTGVVLTKRGQAAQAFLNANRQVSVDDLAPGDIIIAHLTTCNGDSYYSKAEVLSVGEMHETGKSRIGDGEWITNYGRTVHCKIVKTGESYSATGFTTFQKVFSPEVEAEMKAAALAYQATLTTTGTVAKRAKKAGA